MIIHDVTGVRWEVARGDPAWWLVTAITKEGLRELVLPRESIITGKAVEMERPDMGPLTNTIKVLWHKEVPLSIVEPIEQEFLKAMALDDCCIALAKLV